LDVGPGSHGRGFHGQGKAVTASALLFVNRQQGVIHAFGRTATKWPHQVLAARQEQDANEQ